MKKIIIFTVYLLFHTNIPLWANSPHLIPYPNYIERAEGIYTLGKVVTCHVKGDCENEHNHLLHLLEKEYGLQTRQTTLQKASIRMELDKNCNTNTESYTLRIDKNGIMIRASGNAGLFYGVQTLRQLISRSDFGGITIPYVYIEDAPRFKWRAMLLDEARTFHGMKMVKQLLDELSYLKINRIQWHLTDDQGWRIEIKKYTRLTEINTPLTLSDNLEHSNDENARKGYYTQDEIRKIVQYAKERHITIVPEIEMPGHASAAIAAYPWLGVTKTDIMIPVTRKPVVVNNIHLDIFDVTDPRTRLFFEEVLTEVASLFQSEIIHIGGDEVNFSQWKESEHVNQFMKEKGIISPAELQRWFTNQISYYLSKKGLRMMGWNDIMGKDLHNYEENDKNDFAIQESLAPGTIVHFWKGDPELIKETVEMGYEVVNAYHLYTYMDYTYQSIPLEKSYSFEPVPNDLPVSLHHKIIGLGCQMWGGSVCTIETQEKLYKQIFPRISAYAEIGWTMPEKKNFERYIVSLHLLKGGWNERGIHFYEKLNEDD